MLASYSLVAGKIVFSAGGGEWARWHGRVLVNVWVLIVLLESQLSKCDSIKWSNMSHNSRHQQEKRTLGFSLVCCVFSSLKHSYNAPCNIRTKQTNKHAQIAYTYTHQVHISCELLFSTYIFHIWRNSILILYSNTQFFAHLRGKILRKMKHTTIWNSMRCQKNTAYQLSYMANIAYTPSHTLECQCCLLFALPHPSFVRLFVYSFAGFKCCAIRTFRGK